MCLTQLACVARRPIWVPTRAMIAGRRTLILAIEKAMRRRLKVGRSHSHIMRPHMSCKLTERTSTTA